MKAAVLEDIRKMKVQSVPDPQLAPHEVVLRVRAVGVCGTDLHLFQGLGNYNRDPKGRAIPLTEQPQILGHEFSGEVVEVGKEVKDLKPGDRVLCDQGRNCYSQQRRPLCPYCASGDSHQCAFYQEHGITGLQGALAEYIAIPAVNCLRLPDGMTTESGALVEPLGCILHSSSRVEAAHGRYTLDGAERIRNVLILGSGPAGLLFLQYLRNVRKFDGKIFVADLRDNNLQIARRLGATIVNSARQNLVETVREQTGGQGVQYVIEACGSGAIYDEIPKVLCKQGTLLMYATGHKGRELGVIDSLLFIEPTVVASAGASGGFEPDGRPSTYRNALEHISSGLVQTAPFVTHRYNSLENIHTAFQEDFERQDYIKGVLNLA
jgi:threonine dehydrogenase-like Zn-dependent dehydrogenase